MTLKIGEVSYLVALFWNLSLMITIIWLFL